MNSAVPSATSSPVPAGSSHEKASLPLSAKSSPKVILRQAAHPKCPNAGIPQHARIPAQRKLGSGGLVESTPAYRYGHSLPRLNHLAARLKPDRGDVRLRRYPRLTSVAQSYLGSRLRD